MPGGTEVVVLLSSSPRTQVFTPIERNRDIIPDSDESPEPLPSLKKLLVRGADSRLKSGSRAATAPSDATIGFQSASTLLKYNLLNLKEDGKVGEREKEGKATSKSKAKARKHKTAKEDGGEKIKVIRRKKDVLPKGDGSEYFEIPGKQRRMGKWKVEARKEANPAEGDKIETGCISQKDKQTDPYSKVERAKKRKSDEAETPIDGGLVVIEYMAPRDAGGTYTNDRTKPLQCSLTQAEVYDPTNLEPRKRRKKDPEAPTNNDAPKIKIKRKTKISSSHFPPSDKSRLADSSHPCPAKDAPALRRKTDWTPPAKANLAKYSNASPRELTTPEVLISPQLESEKLAMELSIHGALSSPPQTELPFLTINFGNLQKAFGYQRNSNSASDSHTRMNNHPAAPIGTRKRLELIEAPVVLATKPNADSIGEPQLVEETTKISPTKRYKSITDRVIAKYHDPGATKTLSKASPHFAPIFDSRTKPPKVSEVTTSKEKVAKDGFKPPRVRKSRQSVEGREKQNKTKKPPKTKARDKPIAQPEQKLVSPKAFAYCFGQQEILFGTSSQLRSNDDPSVLHDIQQAIRESEIGAVVVGEHRSSPVPIQSTGARRRTSPKLWAAAEEALVGSNPPLAEIEELDKTKLVGNSLRIDMSPPVTVAADNFVDIDDSVPLSTFASAGFFLPSSKSSSPVPVSHQAEPAVLEVVQAKDNVSDGATLEKSWHYIDEEEPSVSHTQSMQSRSRSNSALPTSHPAAYPYVTSIAGVSFARPTLRAMSTNTKSPTKVSNDDYQITKSNIPAHGIEPGSGSPRKARGRPRKDVSDPPSGSIAKKQQGQLMKMKEAKKLPKKRGRQPNEIGFPVQATPAKDSIVHDGFRNIDEIEDSEVDCTPTPPKPRGRPPSMSPLSLTKVTDKEEGRRRAVTTIVTDKHSHWPKLQEKLFLEITATVQSQPRSGRKKLGWYEKILLYDPIVLEDLTAWLNKQGLRVEGKDKEAVEVSVWMVQSWCERNSVCCLWREGGSSWRSSW